MSMYVSYLNVYFWFHTGTSAGHLGESPTVFCTEVAQRNKHGVLFDNLRILEKNHGHAPGTFKYRVF